MVPNTASPTSTASKKLFLSLVTGTNEALTDYILNQITHINTCDFTPTAALYTSWKLL